MQVRIKRLKDVPMPSYATAGSAGMDLSAAIDTSLILAPGKRILVPTGISVAVPEGFEMQLRPRSGLAIKHGISLLNTPATIDSDYRGEIIVIMVNLGDESFTVEPGMRICQMMIVPYPKITWQEVDKLDDTERGEKRFGSSGL
jgi:dUTP pyrophosphatase